MERLFSSGSSAGVPDGQLLARFVEQRDSAAFEALISRHGPMVIRVCRQVLRDPEAVSDAFQATMLVLVRKAGTVRVVDSLGPWLHGVAFKVASRSRATTTKRQGRERQWAETAGPTPVTNELELCLHRELANLPARFGAPIVLCHLEGLTHDQAASKLA